ncbi:MAG: hypothetical protein H7331_04555 [Bacteroidia bacterium]|nr:hypothetical protein [Bacteroidia bacterium]
MNCIFCCILPVAVKVSEGCVTANIFMFSLRNSLAMYVAFAPERENLSTLYTIMYDTFSELRRANFSIRLNSVRSSVCALSNTPPK